MKKSLSLLLALGMVAGSLSSVAAAADDNALSTEQKYQQLVDNGILKGTTDGQSHLADSLTRAQFATIAIAIAGLKEDAASASAFSDVKAGQWWTGAINAAKNAGLVDGIGGGLFSPKANVTVQEVIKVADAIAKLTPVEGATVEGAAAWAGPYIKAAQDAGLPVPATGFTAPATRGQAVDLAYAVFQAAQVKPLSDAKAVVNADDTITVTGKTAGGVDGVKVAVGTGDAAAATLNADGTFTYTTAKQAVGDYKLTVTAYKGTTSVASAELAASIQGFKVESVTVLNGKQLAVTFNKAVKEGTSENAFKYKGKMDDDHADDYYFDLEGQDLGAAPSLSDDKKTVTLTFNHFVLDRYAQFRIFNGLKSASGQDLGAVKQAVYLTDKTAPSVKAVSYSGKDAIVEFSEPLSDVGAVSIDGSTIDATASTDDIYYELVPNDDIAGDFNKIKIHNLAVDTSYTLDIVSAQDIAANYLNYTGTLKVASDDTLPTVSSLTVDGSTVVVKFSEALKDKAATLSVVDGENDEYSVSSYDSDTNTAKFNLKDELNGKSFVSKTVYFAADAFQDLQGNSNKATSKQTITLSADKTKPKFVSVTTSGAEIIAKYSEEIDASALAGQDVKFKFTDNDGVVKSGNLAFDVASVYDLNDDGDTDDADEHSFVVLTVTDTDLLSGSSLKAGKYSVTIPSGIVADTSDNKADQATLSFTVSGASAKADVKLTDVKQADDNNNIVYFEFDSKLNKSQLDASKFLMAGAALPSGTNFYFTDDTRQEVAAELPSGTIPVNGKRNFQVKGIVFENGHTLDTSNDTIKNVDLIENKAPTAVSATLLDDQTLSVTFSEALDLAPTSSGITITINGKALDSDAIDSVDASGKTLTIGVKNSDTFKSGQTVVVEFSGAGVKDANGNGAADGKVTVK